VDIRKGKIGSRLGSHFESFALSFCIVSLKCLLITLEPHLIKSEVNHMLVKIKETLCANVPKGVPQQIYYVDKEQFKIK